MREMRIVLGLIEQGDNYYLQLRGTDPRIGAAGMIGCFGGKIEDADEDDPRRAVLREILEEVGLSDEVEDVQDLGEVEVESDHQLEKVKVLANVFRLLLGPDVMVDPNQCEGELIKISRDKVRQNLHLMTPGTKACFEQLVLEN